MFDASLSQGREVSPPAQFPFDVNTVSNLLLSLLGNTDIRLSILDDNGNALFSQGSRSQFCACVQENPSLKDICSSCTRQGIAMVNRTRQPYTYRCAMGLDATILPLLAGEQISGYLIFSGYRMEDELTAALPAMLPLVNMEETYPQLYALREHSPFYPKAQIDEILQLLSITVSYLATVSAHTQMLMDLQSRSLELLTNANIQEQREKKVNQVKLRALRYQVWDEFLFDAMERIAQIAEEEGASHTAQLIQDLALNARKGRRPGVITTLGQEIQELDSHLRLLDAMYGGRIRFAADADPNCDPEAELVQIPFASVTNVILSEPLMEAPQGRSLEILISQQGNTVMVSFLNNATQLPPALIRDVNHLKLNSQDDNWRNFQRILEELRSNCGSSFHFKMTNMEPAGTRLDLFIPICQGDEL